MTGPEVSVFAVCDGTRAVALAPGPGLQAGRRRRHRARTPAAWAPTARCRGSTDGFADDVIDRFVQPTLDELRRRGIDYRGVLYAGLMLTADGPKLVEYNIRFGDPDSQVVLLRLTTDLGRARSPTRPPASLDDEPAFDDDAAVLVVAAAEGYPDRRAHRRRHRRARRGRGASTGVTVLCAGVGRRRRRAAWSPPGAACSRSSAGAPTSPPPGLAPTTAVGHLRLARASTTEPTSPARMHRHDVQGRHPDGLAQRQGQDAAGRRHAGAVRHRGRRAGALGPPHARPRSPSWRPPRARTATAPSSAAPAWPPTSPARWPPTPRCPVVGVPDLERRAQRRRRALRHRADAPGHPGGHRRHRRRQERRAARRADAGHQRRRTWPQQLADHRIEIAG